MRLRGLDLPVSFAAQYRSIEMPPWGGVIDRKWERVLTSDAKQEWRQLINQSLSSRSFNQHERGRRYLFSKVYESRGIWFKSYPNVSLSQRIARLLGRNKASNAWRNAWFLIQCGITTPRPVLALNTLWWRRQPEWVAFEDFANAQTFTRCYLNQIASGRSMQQLLIAVGQFVGQLHESRWWHRDLNGSNLLVRASADSTYKFCIVDINRMRRTRRMNQYKRIHDLVRLGVSRADYETLLKSYADVTDIVVDANMLRRALDHSQQLHAARQARSYLRWWLKVSYQLGKIRNLGI